MAAIGDSLIQTQTVKLESTSPRSPSSNTSTPSPNAPTTEATSAENRLQSLLQHAAEHGLGGRGSPNQVQVSYSVLQQHFANLAQDARPPPSPNAKGLSTHRTTKVERLSPTVELAATQTDPSSKTFSAPPQDDKPRINNNSVCYTSGGRLKFFKEGRCLLELTHRSGEGGETWVPITKKVYWPPPGPVVAESSPSVQSATSEGGSDSVPSPYPPGIGLCPTIGSVHRIKTRPRNFLLNSQSTETLDQLVFWMRPPACIVSLRKKVRNFDKRCRQPYKSIGVAAFIMKLEAEAIKVRPARRPVDRDHIRKASRLEKCVTRVVTKAKQKKSGPLVSIQAWKATTTSSSSVVSVTKSSSQPKLPVPVTIPYPPKPPNASSVMRVKSELCPVTETCTAATMPPSSPSTGTKTPKHKSDSRNACLTTTSLKTLPITPTIARIKHEQSGQSPSLVSTDIHGMKVEIGRQYSPTHHLSPAPMMPTSPIPDMITPRKRFLQDLDNTSPAKRHRLNSDVKGGDGIGLSNGGTASPHPPHLFMHPHGIPSPPRPGSMGNGHSHQPMPHQQQQPKVSSFSIDSLMSGSKFDRVDYGPHSPVNVSSPKPVKPVAMTPRRSPAPSHQSSSTPLVVPITPYSSRGIDPRTPIDPRLAHLAGVAADPRLGLSPAATAMAGYMMNPFYSSYLAAAASLWRPSPDASVVSGHQQPPQLPVQSPSPPSTATSISGPTSYPPWIHQYRGEPRLESSAKRDLEQQKLQDMDTGADSPLNLSVRR